MTATVIESEGARPAIVRYPILDELRGMAVVAIIVNHCMLSTPTIGVSAADRIVEQFRTPLPIALDLFFVISGFLITLILDRTRNADHTIRTFYIRRALRIVPLYYGFLLFAAVFLQYLGPVATGGPGSAKWEWLFLTNFALARNGANGVGALYPHFWSLAIEEHFYLVWPWVVVFMTPKNLLRVCGLTMVGCLAGRLAMVAHGSWYAAWLVTPTRLDSLAVGSAVAILHRHYSDFLKRTAVPAMLFTGLVATPLFFLVVYMAGNADTSLLQNAAIVAGPTLFGLFFGSVVATAASRNRPDGKAGPLGEGLRSIARYSYGMYVLHVPLIVMLFHTGRIRQRIPLSGYDFPYRLAFVIMILMISYVGGLFSWHLYEKRFLALAPAYRYGIRKSGRVAESGLQSLPVS
jgi:Predicted acyltransferases